MMERPVRWAKLDPYDYEVHPGEDGKAVISIAVDSMTDLEVADISTDITSNDGFIYLEGKYYKLIDMRVIYGGDPTKAWKVYIRVHELEEEAHA